VLLGNGDGTFRAGEFIAASGRPNAVTVGDLAGNGVLDLVVTNFVSNSVSVLLGNGDGTFQAPVSYAVGVFPGAVVLGDFRGNGTLDLAVANTDSPATSTLSVLRGNGDGTFQSAHNYAAGAMPLGLVVEDFTGDGVPDLAVSGWGGTRVLAGNGDGTFQTTSFSYVTGTTSSFNAYSVAAVGDFNCDGLPDLAIVGNQRVFILTNDGSRNGGPRVTDSARFTGTVPGRSHAESAALRFLATDVMRTVASAAASPLPGTTELLVEGRQPLLGICSEARETPAASATTSFMEPLALDQVLAQPETTAVWLSDRVFAELEAARQSDRLLDEPSVLGL
jgi:hypothetical protein